MMQGADDIQNIGYHLKKPILFLGVSKFTNLSI